MLLGEVSFQLTPRRLYDVFTSSQDWFIKHHEAIWNKNRGDVNCNVVKRSHEDITLRRRYDVFPTPPDLFHSVFATAKASVLDRVYIEVGLILSQQTHQLWYFVWKLTLSQSMFTDVVPTLTKNLETLLTIFVDLIFRWTLDQ